MHASPQLAAPGEAAQQVKQRGRRERARDKGSGKGISKGSGKGSSANRTRAARDVFNLAS